MVNYSEIRLCVKLDKPSNNFERDRNELRKKALNIFLKEKPGKGTKELASKYKYIAEELNAGNYIYLTRPARLNKGFDFVIHVSNNDFGPRLGDVPRHVNIIDDIRMKKREDNDAFERLYKAIDRVYNCEDPVDILLDLNIEFREGYAVDMILKTIKWFFIEQDTTYWNWSGRAMFMSEIKKIANS